MTLNERFDLLIQQFHKLTGKIFKITTPPAKPGVYVGIMCNQFPVDLKIMYVGSSQNIDQRLRATDHPLKNNYNVLMCCECENYQQVENVLLRSVQTRLNKQRVNWKRNA